MKHEVNILKMLGAVAADGVPEVLAIGKLHSKQHGFLMPLYKADMLQEARLKGLLSEDTVMRLGSQVLAVLKKLH